LLGYAFYLWKLLDVKFDEIYFGAINSIANCTRQHLKFKISKGFMQNKALERSIMQIHSNPPFNFVYHLVLVIPNNLLDMSKPYWIQRGA
jgi:hypothetical protein